MPKILLALAAVALAGCGVGGLFGPQGGPYPGACEELGFVARQCAGMVARAESQSGVKAVDTTGIDILPPTYDGVARIGGSMVSRVRFHLADKTELTEEIWCIGIGRAGAGYDACDSDPRIWIAAPGVTGDTTCTDWGPPPTGCTTPPPTPRPQSQTSARPLRVPILDIPLDHLGRYVIDVGEAGLPDGAFSGSSVSVVDEHPTTFWIRDAELVIKPVDSTRPPVGSLYREPFEGVEQVRVTLEFDVDELSPGAVLQVRDIVVE